MIKSTSESQLNSHEVAHFHHLLGSESTAAVGDNTRRQGVSAEDLGGQQLGDLLTRCSATGQELYPIREQALAREDVLVPVDLGI